MVSSQKASLSKYSEYNMMGEGFRYDQEPIGYTIAYISGFQARIQTGNERITGIFYMSSGGSTVSKDSCRQPTYIVPSSVFLKAQVMMETESSAFMR